MKNILDSPQHKKIVPSDVSPSTSLPPLVEGQLRCFLRVTVGKIVWTIIRPPPLTLVKLKWWGESSDGTFFNPKNGQIKQKGVSTTARFPVRCRSKQLTSYLTNMGSLILDVLKKADHSLIARTHIPGISLLSFSHTISGYFTLVSPTSGKLGELQVTLALEPLTDGRDSTSPDPSIDSSLDAQAPVDADNQNKPVMEDQDLLRNREEEVVGHRTDHMPRGKDYMYSQEAFKVNILEDDTGLSTSAPVQSLQPNRQTPTDLLSVILERGSKLRNAMVISAFKSDVEAEIPLAAPRINTDALPLVPSGQFLKNILQSELQIPTRDSEDPAHDKINSEEVAVNLLLGSVEGSVGPYWDGEGSLPDSCSDHCNDVIHSDLNDPQYDHSLIENLFYKSPYFQENPQDTGKPGPVIISHLDSENMAHPKRADDFHMPSLDYVALLGDVGFVRIIISELQIPTDSESNSSKKERLPRPLASHKCLYILEYNFSSVSDEDGHVQSPEIRKVISRKVKNGAVIFHHQTEFPVRFSRSSLKQWWEKTFSFDIYSRSSYQKTAARIGTAVFPLSSMFESESLTFSAALPVQRIGNADKQAFGPLKVSFELGVDKKSCSSSISIKRSAKPTQVSQKTLSPNLSQRQNVKKIVRFNEDGGDPSPERSDTPVLNIQMPQSDHRNQASVHDPLQKETEEMESLLYIMLSVPDGKDFNCAPMQANVYLICKMLGTDETTQSTVSWGQTHPTFSFIQVTPVALTSRLLERMKNNMMVIEVWLKASRQDHDKLLGLVKLPLHQFYMSFRNPKIAELLLQSPYPVIGVDGSMPVVDVFSGSTHGSLSVCLAMGHMEQISALQRMRKGEQQQTSPPPRPTHMLDHRPQTLKANAHADVLLEHVFLIRVEQVKCMLPLQSTVWGEADCYIQYSFPTHNDEERDNKDPHIVECNISLKTFRTKTTLCVPDPVFGHLETHVLLTAPDFPVQRLLMGILSSQGLKEGGGVQFDLWCRYYYPNVRDQLVARGLLPMSKLCGLVTLQKQGQTETQHFTLPLVPRSDSADQQIQPPGLLEVNVQYKSRPMRNVGGASNVMPSRRVILVVKVLRASGLQAAAKVLARSDSSFEHFSEVGLNSFVTMQLSFLPDTDVRSTDVVSRSFCPEFQHHTEFVCELLVQRSSGESASLAELLHKAVAIFTIYNRQTFKHATKPKDTLVGSVKVKLADLIYKQRGISGWYSLSLPPNTPSFSLHRLRSAGCLEISIGFSPHMDRERVITSARGLGWNLDDDSEDETDAEDEDSLEESAKTLKLAVSMPRIWLPIHCLLLPGHEVLERSTYCYYRYKLYNQQSFCSELRHPVVEELEVGEGLATVAFSGSRDVVLRKTQPLLLYLREEKLEVQVWVAFGKEKRVRPHDGDRLVGSAFVDLSALTRTSKNQQAISGVYPLFMGSSADLSGAALRVHIHVTTDSFAHEVQIVEELHGPEEEEVEDIPALQPIHTPSPSKKLVILAEETPESTEVKDKSTKVKDKSTKVKDKCTEVKDKCTEVKDESTEVEDESSKVEDESSKVENESTEVKDESTELKSDDDTFIASITVERAMHLSLKGCPLAEKRELLSSCFVSFAVAEAHGTVTTTLISDTNCPVWDHKQESRLSKELLLDPQQRLVFKVWHKGDVERLIGDVSVDLSPLLFQTEFQSVCGWYNITDVTGQCQGQLKVSVSPLRPLHELRAQRQLTTGISAPDSSGQIGAVPLFQTSATYSNFPSHISRFIEQRITTPLDQPERLRSDCITDHHTGHVGNVSLFPQTLMAVEKPSCISNAADPHPCNLSLASALRKNLSELDEMQIHLKKKLSTHPIPLSMETQGIPRQENKTHSETNTSHPLLMSSLLAGKVNDIIKEHQTKDTSTTCKAPSSTVLVETSSIDQVIILQPSRPEIEPRLDKVLEVVMLDGDVLPTCSHVHERAREKPSEMEERPHLDFGDDESDHENEDFEETLIPQHILNEITSITDRTSPWTSLLSDPDPASPESLEFVQHQTCHSPRREPNQTYIIPQARIDVDSDSDSLMSAPELGLLWSDCADQPSHVLDEDGGLPRFSAMKEDDANKGCSHVTPSVSSSIELEDEREGHTAKDTASASNSVPNFFLPTDQIEASIRAWAPYTSDEFLRPTQPTPSIPPYQRSEKIKRVTNIFAPKF